MEELIRKLENKKELISSSEYSDKLNNKEYEVINFVVKTIKELDAVTPTIFLLASMLSNVEDSKACHDIYDKLINSDLFDLNYNGLDVYDMCTIYGLLFSLLYDKDLKKLKDKVISNKYFLKSPLISMSLNNIEREWYDDYKNILEIYLDGDYNRFYDILTTLYYLSNFDINIDKYLGNYMNYLDALNYNKGEEIKANEIKEDINNREVKRMINKDLDKMYKMMKGDTSKILEHIISYLYKVEDDKKKFNKNKYKSINDIDEIIRYIKSFKDNELINLDNNKEVLINSVDISNEIIDYIINHNNRIISSLENEVNILSSKVDNNVLDVFVNEHIDIHKLGIYHEIIMSGKVDINYIKEVIKVFKSNFNGFNLNSVDFGSILVKSNINVINVISSYLKRNIIDIDFINNNSSIFTNEEDYNRLHDNILILESFNASTLNEKVSSILLIDSNDLLRRIKIAKYYGINLNDCDTLEFLSNDNFIRNIDVLIETGNLDLVINYPSNLLLDINALKRLIIYDRNNIPYRNEFKLFAQVKSGKNSLVNNEELDSLIMGNNLYIESLEVDDNINDTLDDLYYENEYLYNIEDIMISRKKVLRNMSVCDNLLECIISGSLLDNSSINIIKSSLDNNLSLGRSSN